MTAATAQCSLRFHFTFVSDTSQAVYPAKKRNPLFNNTVEAFIKLFIETHFII